MKHRGIFSRWGIVALTVLAVVSVLAAACGDDDSTSKPSNGNGSSTTKGFSEAGYKTAGLDKAKNITIDKGANIKIGISSALSGDVKSLGQPIADSAAAAGDGVEISGHKIEFVREDDLCTAEGGPAAADRLLKANIVAAIGPICSGGARASLATYDKAGITHISPSATAGDLTSPTRAEGPYVTFFRVPVLNSDEAKAQAAFAVDKLKAKKAFVVFDTDDYGKDLSQQFQEAFKAKGGTIVGSPAGYEKKQTDFKSIISNIKAAKPDMVYMAGFYAEATPFLKQLRAESDLKTIPYMGGDGIKNDELLSGAGADAEGAYLALPGTTGAKFADYKAKYKDADSATFGAESWDSASIIIEALKKVAKDDGGKLTIDLKALNEAIKNTNMEGASGKITFGNNGDRSGAVVRFFQVKGGKYEEIK